MTASNNDEPLPQPFVVAQFEFFRLLQGVMLSLRSILREADVDRACYSADARKMFRRLTVSQDDFEFASFAQTELIHI